MTPGTRGRAVERAEGLGAARVGLVVDVEQRVQGARARGVVALQEAGREPACGAPGDQRRGAAGPDRAARSRPAVRGADRRAAAGHRQAEHPVGVADGELERDGATEGDARDVERAAARLVDDARAPSVARSATVNGSCAAGLAP